MQQRRIASEKEWEYALNVIKTKENISSGFKIDCRQPEHKEHLSHSFLYLHDNKEKNILVSLARHHWLGQGSFGIVKLAEDKHGKTYAIKILKTPICENEKIILEKMAYLYFTGTRDDGRFSKYYILQDYFEGITLTEYLNLHELDDHQKKVLANLKVALY